MKVAFLDRDGVINKEIDYLYKVKDFEYTNKCVSGLQSLISSGYKLVIVTNQAGIARGLFTIQDYRSLMNWMEDDLKQFGVNFLDILFCPHHPQGTVKNFTKNCNCRKPLPGMFIKAKNKFDIDMKNSIVIGDKKSDIEAGKSAGVGKAFLVRSGHPLSKDLIDDVLILDDLFAVAKYLEKKDSRI